MWISLICQLVMADALDTPLHIHSEWTATTKSGTQLTLPPAYIISDAKWGDVNGEIIRLQQSEVRLKAENDHFRASQTSSALGLAMLSAASIGAGLAIGLWVLD